MVKDEGLAEITLRKYERPYDMDRRQLVKKICLSLGLLQPGDSRDVIIDILMVLLESRKNKEKLTAEQIKERAEKIRKENNLELKGLANSNVRRQLKRLNDFMIIDKQANYYNLSEFESLSNIFDEKIHRFIIEPSINRVKEHLEMLDKENQNA